MSASTRTSLRASLLRYGAAVLAVFVAWLIRWLLDPLVHSSVPYPTFFAAVALVAWYFGTGPVLLTIVLGGVVGNYAFVLPRFSFFLDPVHQVGLALYLGTSLCIAWLGLAMRNARHRAEALAREAYARQERLEQEIAERGHAEEAVRLAKAQLRLIIDSVPVLISYMDTDMRFRMANRAYLPLFGKEPAQLIGMHLHELLGDSAWQIVAPHVARALAGEELSYEATVQLGNDPLRTFHATYIPHLDAHGNVLGFFGLVQDITEQKRTEAALREADRRKDEFLATLAHELRNPLAPIRNALLILNSSTPSPDTRAWAYGVIERQLQQLTRLVDDLLDLSRITRGKIELRKERLAIADVVASALETSRPHIEAADLALTVTLPPEPLYVDADATRLAQVLANLLNNAAKYTEPKGHISLTAERDQDTAVLRVRDTGIGISAEMLPRVFDMFTQVNIARDRAQGGLGIGLTLVRRLVEMHGGTVEAHSDGPGKGSELVVRLPLARTATEAALAPQAASAPDETRRILVVDDNEDSADTLALALTMLGNRVQVAYSGEQALAGAHSFEPEVILLDIGLPDISGYEVARRIRHEPNLRHAVLIAQTGWGQDEDRRRSQEAGFDHHLVKPIDLGTLRTLLAELSGQPGFPRNTSQRSPSTPELMTS